MHAVHKPRCRAQAGHSYSWHWQEKPSKPVGQHFTFHIAVMPCTEREREGSVCICLSLSLSVCPPPPPPHPPQPKRKKQIGTFLFVVFNINKTHAGREGTLSGSTPRKYASSKSWGTGVVAKKPRGGTQTVHGQTERIGLDKNTWTVTTEWKAKEEHTNRRQATERQRKNTKTD